MVIGAAIGYRASPFYWLKQIAVADKEFDLKQNKFKARHAARLIPKLSAMPLA